MSKYFLSKTKKTGQRCYQYIEESSSPLFWERNKQDSKQEKIKVSYRTEKVDGYKRVYYILVDYPSGETWEYFLTTSKSILTCLKQKSKGR